MIQFFPKYLRQLRDVLIAAPAHGDVLTYDAAIGKWVAGAAASGDVILADVNNGKSYRLISVDGALATEEI